MNIREAAILERVPTSMDELAEACKKGSPIQVACPNLSADVARKANALKESVTRLKAALEKSDGSPPLHFLGDRPPLWSRLNTNPELRKMAWAVGHYSIPQAEFDALMKTLKAEFGDKRAVEAMMELTSLDAEKKWVTMRPSVLKACRIAMGPPPDDPDYLLFWSDRGGPPKPRSPDDPAPEEDPPKEEPKSEAKKPARKAKVERPAKETARKTPRKKPAKG
jgi:hypothetical protein